MSLFLDDGDVQLWHGDALTVLQTLKAESVHMCVTSPPFYGLRSYLDNGHVDKPLEIGLEATPEQWVASLVAVFREVRRVLRPDGTLWLEIGDSYASAPVGSFNGGGFKDKSAQTGGRDMSGVATSGSFNKAKASGCKPKDLIGAPWMLAFALRADGWYLRSDIVWSRPNPMPESVTDRPTKSHSYVFLLSKRPRYFFDQEAVREPHSPFSHNDGATTHGHIKHREGEAAVWRASHVAGHPNGRNVRSVWNIATQPYPEAHFATFPEELARRCILAGSPRLVCDQCGNVLDPVYNTADDYSTVPGVREDVSAEAQPGAFEAKPADVLFAGMLESESGAGTSQHQGLCDESEGLQAATGTGSPGRIEGRLHHGTQAGDGIGAGSTLEADGGCSPQERREGGQQAGELGSDAETETRPAQETAYQADRVSSLWGEIITSGRVVRAVAGRPPPES